MIVRPRLGLMLPAFLLALSVAGCGGSGGDGAGVGVGEAELALRVVWGSSPEPAAPSPAGVDRRDEVPGGSVATFGDPLPPAVVQGRVIVNSAGSTCCIAFDPRDPLLGGERRFVLVDLQPGLAGVQISGFGVLPVPSGETGRCRPADGSPLPPPEEALAVCSALPTGLAQPCVADSCSVPSFDSGPNAVTVELVAGQERSAGDVATPRQPFLLDLHPECEETVPPGGEISVKVVEAFAGSETTPVLTPESVEVVVTQVDTVPGAHTCPTFLPPDPYMVALPEEIACSDRPAMANEPTCSDDPTLDVGGVIAAGKAAQLELASGCVEVRVTINDGREICYDLLVDAGGPTPTGSPAPSPTPPPPTPTPSGTPVPTPTPAPTPTPTRAPTPTPTRSPPPYRPGPLPVIRH